MAEWGHDLAPTQLWHDVSVGVDAIGHALNTAMEAGSDAVVVSVNWSNAFNCLSLIEMVSAVQEDPSSSNSCAQRTLPGSACTVPMRGRPSCILPESAKETPLPLLQLFFAG